jgi:hypothetical protein
LLHCEEFASHLIDPDISICYRAANGLAGCEIDHLVIDLHFGFIARDLRPLKGTGWCFGPTA